jgi:hypothetical protein
MEKYICFIHSETVSSHNTNEDVSKKNLYYFSRMLSLSYKIINYKNNKYTENISIFNLVDPKWIIIPEYYKKKYENIYKNISENTSDIETIIENFKTNIKNINILIGYDIDYHLKTLFAEALRYNISLDLSCCIIIDIKTFNNSYQTNNIDELYKKLISKKDSDSNNDNEIDKTIYCFNKLYNKFKKNN